MRKQKQESLVITVYAEPLTSTERTLIYQGPETTEVQATIDEQLQSGQAITMHIERSDGRRAFQFLPSYCKDGWPDCLTCTCKEH